VGHPVGLVHQHPGELFLLVDSALLCGVGEKKRREKERTERERKRSDDGCFVASKKK